MGYFQFVRENIRWLAAAVLVTFSSTYGQTVFISVFAGEIRAEFNLSHGAWGGIYTLGTTLAAIAMVWGGMLSDRFRVRTLGPVFLVFLAISCLAMATVSAPWALVVIIFALRFTGQGMLYHIGMVATARWFVATRGRAMSITALGVAIGSAMLPLIYVALLPVFNWRILWVIAAGLTLLIIPILLMLLRQERTPQSISTSQQAAGMNGLHWKRGQILRHWLFWLMAPALIGPAAWSTALFFQQVHLAEVKGWAHLEFVALFPLHTGVAIVATVITGSLIDRFGTNRIIPFYLIPFIFGFLVIGWAHSLLGAAVGMVLIGASSGIGNTLIGAFWAEHCGTRHIGSIKAVAAAVMVFGSAIGPGVSGWLIDRGFSFPQQTIAIAIYFAIAALLATMAALRARPLLPVSA